MGHLSEETNYKHLAFMYAEHIIALVICFCCFSDLLHKDNHQVSKKGEGSILVASARFNQNQCIIIFAKLFRTGTSPFQGLWGQQWKCRNYLKRRRLRSKLILFTYLSHHQLRINVFAFYKVCWNWHKRYRLWRSWS